RIELTTSPLPRECSTTELRQHNSGTTTGEITLRSRRDPCHRGYAHASELPRRLRSRPLHGSCHGSWHGSCHALSFAWLSSVNQRAGRLSTRRARRGLRRHCGKPSSAASSKRERARRRRGPPSRSRGRTPIKTDYVRLKRTPEPQSANVEV